MGKSKKVDYTKVNLRCQVGEKDFGPVCKKHRSRDDVKVLRPERIESLPCIVCQWEKLQARPEFSLGLGKAVFQKMFVQILSHPDFDEDLRKLITEDDAVSMVLLGAVCKGLMDKQPVDQIYLSVVTLLTNHLIVDTGPEGEGRDLVGD